MMSNPVSNKFVGYILSNGKLFGFIFSLGHPNTAIGSNVDVNHVSKTSSSMYEFKI